MLSAIYDWITCVVYRQLSGGGVPPVVRDGATSMCLSLVIQHYTYRSFYPYKPTFRDPFYVKAIELWVMSLMGCNLRENTVFPLYLSKYKYISSFGQILWWAIQDNSASSWSPLGHPRHWCETQTGCFTPRWHAFRSPKASRELQILWFN